MKHCIGTKQVNLQPMTRLQYNQFRGWELPSSEDGADEGYLVEYLDGGEPNTAYYEGYVSWSPKAQADAAYRPVTQMTFGDALIMLKAGKCVTRKGWNASNQFVYLVPANLYPSTRNVYQTLTQTRDMVQYQAYLALKTAQGDVATWAPSCSDTLAEDWVLLD